MPPVPRTGPSLKSRLLLWMVPVLLGGSAAGIWSSSQILQQQAQQAYDRALAGVVRAIDLNISTDSGGLALAQPYQLLEFFDLTATGNVFYRVLTEDGLAEIGHGGLPLPRPLPREGQLHFFNGTWMDGQAIRVAMLVRDLDPPLLQGAPGQRVIIQVAESLNQRERYAHEVLLQVVGRDGLVMAALVAALLLGVLASFRPLVRLQREMERRDPDDLRPVSRQGIPAEVVPLVDGINRHMARFARHSQVQRQFLDDASHQLRTPLTTLRTNVEYALRESDPQEVRAALHTMSGVLDRAERVTNQMLSLAKAHDASLSAAPQPLQRFDLVTLLEESVRLLWPGARTKKLDYGLEVPTGIGHCMLRGHRWLVQEAVLNVLDNAIKYCPAGGTVLASIVSSASGMAIVVEDSGPGMSAEDIGHAGLRFRRGSAGKNTAGAGLGLAIVDAIVRAHGGSMRLGRSASCGGLRVELGFPLCVPQPD